MTIRIKRNREFDKKASDKSKYGKKNRKSNNHQMVNVT